MLTAIAMRGHKQAATLDREKKLEELRVTNDEYGLDQARDPKVACAEATLRTL